jgi:hypothetical protein
LQFYGVAFTECWLLIGEGMLVYDLP